MTKHKIWEMIAPNGKPLGECTQEELGQFAEWLTWLAREGAHLHGIKYPPEDDCTAVELMMYAAWSERQEELLKSAARDVPAIEQQTRPETGLPPAPRLRAARALSSGLLERMPKTRGGDANEIDTWQHQRRECPTDGH
jgi:hypothetical protein